MTSHFFVARGNVARLACDAWLLPTDGWFNLTRGFRESLTPSELALAGGWAQRGRAEWAGRRAMPLGDGESTRAWLTIVGARPGTPSDWYVAGVREFLDAVELHVGTIPPANRRERHLVALPLVGTGQGGASDVKGEVTQMLVRFLLDEAAHRPFDIVLVTFTAAAYAAVQSERRLATRGARAPSLSEHQLTIADALATHLKKRSLVLFLGAGISAGAGLPSWREFLMELAAESGFTESDREALTAMDVLDQARILKSHLERQGRTFEEVVPRLLRADRYSLSHALLAALPVNEIATTNYDQLFEAAARDVEASVAVLPYEAATSQRRWLLKLHGCVTHPGDIVLTRTDYLRYSEQRAALAGIVQALLITRHMLFVGFSLEDDNFHRIADEVRRAIGSDEPRITRDPFGTALFISDKQFLHELWKDEVRCVPMVAEAESFNTGTRRLEIFLDEVASRATDNSAHLMDRTYDAVLEPGERELRDHLEMLARNISDDVRSTAAWIQVESLLREFGAVTGGNDHEPGTLARAETVLPAGDGVR